MNPNPNAPRSDAPEARLVVVGFDNGTDAFEMREVLAGVQRDRHMDAVEMVVVVRDGQGKVTLHQESHLAVVGAAYGSFVGLLASLVFLTPAGVLLGFGLGALSGALSDLGISDEFMQKMGGSLANGTSAIFVLVRKSDPDQIIAALQRFSGKCRVIQAPLVPENEARLRALLEKPPAALPEAAQPPPN